MSGFQKRMRHWRLGLAGAIAWVIIPSLHGAETGRIVGSTNAVASPETWVKIGDFTSRFITHPDLRVWE